MDETPHRSAYRVMITIDTVDLPSDSDQRQDVLVELRDQVRGLLDDHPPNSRSRRRDLGHNGVSVRAGSGGVSTLWGAG